MSILTAPSTQSLPMNEKGSSAGMMKGHENENGMMLATRYEAVCNAPECIHHVIYV